MTQNNSIDAAHRAIRYLRDNDCDFLTVANVIDYSSGIASTEDAETALRQTMGDEWFDRQVAAR